mmetsp:Transcript_16004/g.34639  ORF Transcript_16004/g.34639 Transcript_16004/m.34639 type:complete len:320 (+) Transcript_16004:56-1015(+)
MAAAQVIRSAASALDDELGRLRRASELEQSKSKALAVPGEQMLKIDQNQLRAAKEAELLKGIRIRFLADSPDRTIDQFTSYTRETKVEGMSAQQTVLELRQAVAAQEGMAVEDVVLCGQSTVLTDNVKICDLYVDWMGYGLEDWPPRLIAKPRVRGFELVVDVPASRDTSVWEAGRMQSYFDRQLIFDVQENTTVEEVKVLIERKLGIPAARQKLTAFLRESLGDAGQYIPLQNEKSMADYKMKQHCVSIKFEKSAFDANGDYVFDDAYWDEEGYHPPPMDSWIPLDSVADRARPDAHKVDPVQPLSIASDRAGRKAHG